MIRLILILLLTGCGTFNYQINPYFDNQTVRATPGCEDVDENNVTRSLNCAKKYGYYPPKDHTTGGPYYTVGR